MNILPAAIACQVQRSVEQKVKSVDVNINIEFEARFEWIRSARCYNQILIPVKYVLQVLSHSEIPTVLARFISSIFLLSSYLDLVNLWYVHFFAKDWQENVQKEDNKTQT